MASEHALCCSLYVDASYVDALYADALYVDALYVDAFYGVWYVVRCILHVPCRTVAVCVCAELLQNVRALEKETDSKFVL